MKAYEPDPPPSENGDRERLFLETVVGFLWTNFRVAVGLAVIFAAVTAVVIYFVLPPRYEASTTLIVTPPTFSSSLKPPVLSVQGYQKLLESDAVLVEAKALLLEQGLLERDDELRLGRHLRTRIFVSRRSEERALAPIIEATVEARDAELAAAIANAWAEVFLKHNRQLITASTLGTVQFIEEQFVASRDSLDDAEQRRTEAADRYQRRIDEAMIEWDRRLVEFQQGTETRLVKYQAETRLTMERIVGSTTQDVPPEALGSIDRKLSRIVLLRTQLAQTLQFVELEKAISDDALWQVLALQPDRLAELQSRTLVTQELNPVYRELSLELARTELDLDDVAPEHQELLRSITTELETIQRERSAGLANLMAQRAVELEALRKKKQQAIEALRRERDTRLARLDREIQHNRQMFVELAGKYEQAELARAEQNLVDIRLGSQAVPPLRPEPSGLLLKMLVAAVFGALLGLLIALLQPGDRTTDG